MLRESCKSAMWFTDSFNLDLLKITFQVINNFNHHGIEYNWYIHCQVKSTKEKIELPFLSSQPSSSSPSSSSHSSSSHSSLLPSLVDSTEVNEILYLLDRFGISDQFYHELSMLHHDLPRSYEVKKARTAISSVVEIKRLPTPYFGCYRPLKECIIQAISNEVCTF